MAVFSLRQKTLHDYLTTDIPTKHAPVAIRREAKALTTVIVRTSALTDARCTLMSLHSHNCTDTQLTHDTYHALVGDHSALATQLKAALPPSSAANKAKPIKTSTAPWQHSVWHYGAMTKTYWAGDIRLLEIASDITENERDKLYLAAGRAHTKGQLVVVIGESTIAAAKQQLPDITLKGLLIFEPQLRFGTASAIQTLARHKLSIRYLSSQPYYYVDAVARRAGLLQKTTAPAERTMTGLSLDESVYAGLTPGDEARILKTYDSEKTVVVTKPLHEFVHKYEYLLR